MARKSFCSGRSRRGAWGPVPAPFPLFLDQTEAQKAEKEFVGDRPQTSPHPLPQDPKVWIRCS